MRRFAYIASLMLCAAAVSCSRDGVLDGGGDYSSVFIYCALGYNNLSGYLADNLEDMEGGVLPELGRDRAVVAYCHNTVRAGDYETPNPPVLLRLYRDRGELHADTLKIYPDTRVSASADAIHEMLLDVGELFPSERYGMLFSSHASGWMPVGYSPYGESPRARTLEWRPDPSLPLTKTIGAYYDGSFSNSVEMDVRDFARAIPMHLDYMILDACMLGCVEVAWELRDVCDMVVFSPTEVLAQGFVYGTMVMNLLGSSSPDLEKVCREYYERYDGMEYPYRSASVSLVDCSGLDRVAAAFAAIVETAGERLPEIDRDGVQKYFYNDDVYFFYYDLRDLAAAMNPDPALLDELDAALGECVLYHAETPEFFNLELENCCGMSVYFPSAGWPVLNAYYRTLGWNGAVHLVE